MTKYRDHKEVYTRDYTRWSVYPKIPKPDEYGKKSLRPGQILEVEIIDIDEKGRGVANYNGIKIKINGGGTVGDKVKIRILNQRGDEALGEVIRFL